MRRIDEGRTHKEGEREIIDKWPLLCRLAELERGLEHGRQGKGKSDGRVTRVQRRRLLGPRPLWRSHMETTARERDARPLGRGV